MDDFYRIPKSQCYMMLTHQMVGDKSTPVQSSKDIENITKTGEIVRTETPTSGFERSTEESIIKLERPSDEELVIPDVPSKRKRRKDSQKRERAKRKHRSVSTEESERKNMEDSAECPSDNLVSEDLDNVPLEERESRKIMEIIRDDTDDDVCGENIAAINPHDTDELDTTDPSDKVLRVKKTVVAKEKKSRGGKKRESVNYECKPCGYKFSRKWKYERHMNSHARKNAERVIYECAPCGRTFAQPSAYKQHMLKHSTEKPHKCDVCDKAFKRAYELKMHRLIHSGSMYTCDICSFTTAYKVSLMVHKQRVHDKNYRHKCDQCEKAFMSKHELEDHRTRHLGEKSFICEICGNGFLQRSYLIHHKRVVHGVQNRAPMELKCELCNKTFATKYCLQNHISLHSQKFLCSQCGKEFATNYSLRMHNRMHTGERPHKCNMCSKSFARSNALSVHKLTHTGQRPYVCDLCDKSFTQRTTMMAHRRKHPGSHPPPPPTSLVGLEKAADSNS